MRREVDAKSVRTTQCPDNFVISFDEFPSSSVANFGCYCNSWTRE